MPLNKETKPNTYAPYIYKHTHTHTYIYMYIYIYIYIYIYMKMYNNKKYIYQHV